MKITFRESGGFAGLVRGCEVDVSSLPKAAASALDALLASGRLPSGASRGGRDLTSYEIAVETAKGMRKVSLDEMNAPASVRPLLDFLKGRSGPRPLA